MDRRNWPWKKKSAEKIITADPGDSIPKQKPYEQQNSGDTVPENGLDMTSPSVLATKVKELKEQVQRMTAEMKAKDDVVKQHEKVAEEAVTGWEKAEADSISLKQQLEQVMQKKAAAEERVSQLDGALKECVRQLRTVKEEQETAIHGAVKKKARELDAARLELEEKLIEANRRLSEAVEQNVSVSGGLQETRKFLERLKDEKSQVEDEVNQLQARIVFLEKDNASAKHEMNLLATQLEIRTEEKEFTRKAAEAAKKQHLESLKKITKLEADCQKLRVLLRKKLPGPGAIAQMKREAEKAPNDWRRRRPPSRLGHSQENNIRQMQYLSERCLDMEEENSRLRRELENRKGEFHAQAEAHRHSALAHEHFPGPSYAPSHASISEDAEADEASLSGSWASALISELEQFSKEKPTTNSHANQMIKAPEFELMDDFVEMERLATASESTVWPLNQNVTEATKADQRSSCSALSSTGVDVIHEDEPRAGSYPDGKGSISGSEREELLCLILDAHSKGQNLDEVLNKVKEALGARSSNSATEQIHKLKEKLTRLKGLGGESLISKGSLDGVISQQISLGSFSDGNSSEDESDPFSVPDADKRDGKRSRLVTSVQKILRLIESISQSISVDASHSQVSGSVPDYTMRILQWQNSEFGPVVQKAVEVCNNLLQDTAKIEEFVAGVGSVLEWLADHFFSLKDVSTIRDAIKNQLEWHGESQSNSESETEVESQAPPALRQQNDAAYAETLARKLEEAEHLVEKDRMIGQLKEEVNALNHDVSALRIQNKYLDARLHEEFKSHDSMNCQRLDFEREISELRTELAATRGLTESLEDKLEAQITMNEELEVQLRAAIAELNQSREKFTSLQTEIEEKGACFQELEATCLDLQLQLESRNGGGYIDEEPNDVSAVPVADATKDLDISTAARKLAECQKTILDLEKRFKALAGENESNRTLLDMQVEAENPPENTQPETEVPTPEKVVPELVEAKETVAPRSGNGEAREAETKPLKNTKSGLLYGWQLLPESPAPGIQTIDSKDTEQHLDSASPSILSDRSKDHPSNGNNSTRRSSTSSSRELVPYKPKKRTRGGSFGRFFGFSRKA